MRGFLHHDPFFNECLLEMLSSETVLKMNDYVQHGQTTCLEHCVKVAHFSYRMSVKARIRCDRKSMIRGALLHDFFLYDWHVPDKTRGLHGFSHPKAALKNAERYFLLNEIERDVIEKHMWPMTVRLPKYRESVMVCLADKACALLETATPLFRGVLSLKRRTFVKTAARGIQ